MPGSPDHCLRIHLARTHFEIRCLLPARALLVSSHIYIPYSLIPASPLSAAAPPGARVL